MRVVADSSYPLLDVFWTMIVFFGWFLWIWLLITLFGDLFRRTDVSGWGKAGWTVFVLVVPIIGALIYFISQGHGMAERRTAEARASKAEFDSYVRSVAATSSDGSRTAEIDRAKELLDTGAISAEEYETLKAKALSR